MKNRDKRTWTVFIILSIVAGYYFMFPGRNWLGKSYLESAPTNGFAVVELFTSEGCSSCPAAEDLIDKMRAESGNKQIYFLAFHVDYWNNLGWADRFSSQKFSARQQQYAEWMNLQILYTPQFIVNGQSEFAGSDQRTLYRTVSRTMHNVSDPLMLRSRSQDSLIKVDFKVQKEYKDSNLLVALIQKDTYTEVKKGENAGNLLHHAQTVRQTFVAILNKKEGFVTLLKPLGFDAEHWEIIGFIQNNSTGKIIAAAKAVY
ncbi:DUF1223 domain-containing protein [Flavobacterium sp. N1736]|uniref:DUF1223 domain-containing protein n=1 Tax=Flavobacterium sp. N1736 TaxID=2986823 RepID=UPI002223FB9F|nr:DUF1223 domain-containing protein [Flavobacterium sp. N1736]